MFPKSHAVVELTFSSVKKLFEVYFPKKPKGMG
jgi:hypothetical protein